MGYGRRLGSQEQSVGALTCYRRHRETGGTVRRRREYAGVESVALEMRPSAGSDRFVAFGRGRNDEGPHVHDVRSLCADSGGLGELDSRVRVAAVAEGVLREVLLVVVLGVEVRRLAGRPDLGGDLTQPPR